MNGQKRKSPLGLGTKGSETTRKRLCEAWNVANGIMFGIETLTVKMRLQLLQTVSCLCEDEKLG